METTPQLLTSKASRLSCHRTKEAKLSFGVILVLQTLQTLLPPVLLSIPTDRLFITKSVVNIDAHVVLTRSSMEDMAQLIADSGSLLVEFRISRLVCDQGSSEDILLSEGESSTLGISAPNSLGGVTLKHEDRSVERSVRTCLFGKEIPCVLHGGDIVLLKVEREAGVDKTILLAWDSIDIDLCPPGKVAVVSRLRRDGNWVQIVERLGDLGVDALHAFLDEPEEDDRLQKPTLDQNNG